MDSSGSIKVRVYNDKLEKKLIFNNLSGFYDIAPKNNLLDVGDGELTLLLEEENETVEQKHSFHEIISQFPEQNPAGRLEDISVHMAFICALHLANEHGLVIKSVPEMNDLVISNVPTEA